MELVPPSTVRYSPAVERSVKNQSRLETKQHWGVFYFYALKLTCQVALTLVQVSPLKSIFNLQPSISDCCTTVRHSISPSITLATLCDFKSSSDATCFSTVTSFQMLTICNRSQVFWSFRNLRSTWIDLLLRHSSWEVRTFVWCKLSLSSTMTPNYDKCVDVKTSLNLSKSIDS